MKTVAFIKPACADLAEDEIFIPVAVTREEMQLRLSLLSPSRALAVFDAWMELERKIADCGLRIANWN